MLVKKLKTITEKFSPDDIQSCLKEVTDFLIEKIKEDKENIFLFCHLYNLIPNEYIIDIFNKLYQNSLMSEEIILKIEHKAWLYDDLETAKAIVKIKPMDSRIIKNISLFFVKEVIKDNISSYPTVLTTKRIFNYFKEQTLEWKEFCLQAENNNITLISSHKGIFDLMNQTSIQYISDQALLSAVRHCSIKDTLFWIEKGANIIQKNHDLLLSRNINPELKNQYANAEQVRKILVSHYPVNKKTKNNSVWMDFVNGLIKSKNAMMMNELTIFLINKDIELSYIPINILIKCITTTTVEKAKNLLILSKKELQEKKAVYNLFKETILCGREDILHIIINENFDSDEFYNSKMFTKLFKGEMDSAHYNKYKHQIDHVVKILNIIKSAEKLSNNLNIQPRCINKKLKI